MEKQNTFFSKFIVEIRKKQKDHKQILWFTKLDVEQENLNSCHVFEKEKASFEVFQAEY